MQRKIKLNRFLLIINSLLLCSCMHAENENALVFMLHISNIKEETSVNVEVLVNDKSDEKVTKILTLKGRNIIEALKSSPLVLGSNLNLSHLQVIVIDELDICEIKTLINDIDNFYALVYGVQLVVSKDFDALNEKQNQGVEIINKLKRSKKQHLIMPYTFLDLKTHKPILLPLINKEGEIMNEMLSLEDNCKLNIIDQNAILINNILKAKTQNGTFCLDKCMNLSNIKLVVDKTDLIIQMQIDTFQDPLSISTLIKAFKDQVAKYSNLNVSYEISNSNKENYDE